MFSTRFNREIQVTFHAQTRMAERQVTDALLLDLIETGEAHHKDEVRAWIVKHYADRNDNLLCAVVVLESKLVVKTVMHHFEIL